MNLDRITSSILYLEGEAFDCSALRAQLASMTACHEAQQPTARDMLYAMPANAPTISEHLQSGSNPTFTAGRLWSGYSYELTPGQRAILREAYGMTPTQTVTITDIETWKGTRFLRSFKLTSDIHTDPRNRRHVLTSCIIRDAGAFLHSAAELDAKKEAEAVEGAAVGVRKKKKDNVDLVLPTLDDFLKELLS